MKKPMKKLLSILLAAVLFCTVFVGMDMSVAARSTEDIGNDVIKQIEGAQEGATITVNLERGARFQREVIIRKSITVNFIGKYIAGGVHLDDVNGNRVFNIKADNVTLNFGNVLFTNRCREFSDGGAIYIDGNNATITGGVFKSCCSVGNDGGTIYINGKNATVSDSQFIGGEYFNYEEYYPGKDTTGGASQGGAIYINDTGAKIENCRFTNCAAKKEGGAIYANKDRASILNCTFKDCFSHSNDGGAIFTNADDIKIENCSFENCSAKGSNSNGGAICAGYYTDRLIVEGCKFTNCNAGSGKGHWVYGREISDKNTIVHCSKPYSKPNYVECILGSALDCTAKDLTKIDGQPATCTTEGTKPYWECFCGNRYSSDTPGSSTIIANLATWKTGAGKADALGHNFVCKTSGNTVTVECTRNESHMASLTLLEKDSTYPGNTNKTWEVVVAGDKDRAYWSQFAGAGMNFDVWYATLDDNKTSPSNGGATAEGHSPKNAGNYKLVVQITQNGANIPDGRIEQTFTIHPKRMTSKMITLDPVSVKQIPGGNTVNVTVKDGDYPLKKDDYEVVGGTWEESGSYYKVTETDVGTHEVTVTGKGNYADTPVKVKWNITSADPLELTAGSLSASPITYGDSRGLEASTITPNGCVVSSGGTPVSGTYAWEDENIVPDKAGSATYNVVFTPSDSDDLKAYGILKIPVTFDVLQKDISGSVTVNTPDTYNGNDLKGYISVVDKTSGEPYVKGTDYDVICSPSLVRDPGRYNATITFKGNYEGTVNKQFDVFRHLKEEELTFVVDKYYEDEGPEKAITIIINDTTPITLVLDEDYTISGTIDSSGAPLVYKYPATIDFKGFYTGSTIKKTFVVEYPELGPRPAPDPTPTPEPAPAPYYPSTPSNPQSTPAPAPAPSGGKIDGGQGSGSTKIDVVTKDETATIPEISATTISNVAKNTEGELIRIDVSGTGKNRKKISRVSIPKKTVENVVTVLNSPANDKDRLIIVFDTASISADAKSLSSIVAQAKGENIQFVVEAMNQTGLNNSQKSIVDGFNNSPGKNVVQVFQAYVESNGVRVPDFEGGIITVGMVDYKISAGKNERNFHIYYLPTEGKREHCVTWVENKTLYFGTGHFSEYAIVYDETMLNGPGNEVHRLLDTESGDHLFTISKAERDAAQKGGWKYEGVAFIAIEEGKEVYRLRNAQTGRHVYTASEKEKDALVAMGWTMEGTAFLSYGETEVYRLLNPVGMHMFTINEKEKSALVKDGWIYEGVGFKVN